MTTLAITVLEAQPAAQTAAPAITFRLRIEDLGEGRVHALALRCQTRIEPRQRRYTKEEQARLYELFGGPSMWPRSLTGTTWAQTSIVVPSFDRRIDVDLPVACTYDLEVASAKYLHAVRDGDVPLAFLFTGTMFKIAGTPVGLEGSGRAAGLTIEPVAWDLTASFRMPAHVWQAAMDQFFPGGGWLRLRRETIDRLQAFRGRRAVVSWDEALDQLLEHAEARELV